MCRQEYRLGRSPTVHDAKTCLIIKPYLEEHPTFITQDMNDGQHTFYHKCPQSIPLNGMDRS